MIPKYLQNLPDVTCVKNYFAGFEKYKFIMAVCMSAFVFYLLSFTWGLPVTLAGCIAALAVRLCGVRAERVGYCFCFRIGHNWGGFSLGIFMFVCKEAPVKTLWHEHGHGLQNCVFGPFTVFIVSLPSAVRYWYRRLKKDKSSLPPYDSAWFESQATRVGTYQRIKIIFSKQK